MHALSVCCVQYLIAAMTLLSPHRRDHEAKALFEWLKSSQHKLQILGMLGPLPGRTTAVDLDIKKDLGFQYQSAAFRVV